MSRPLRIAMWSGPRNISTALMRSWGNRPDATVRDEPLYSHYLRRTGLDHPGAGAVIAAQESDWRRVVAGLVGDPWEEGKTIDYQKHMAHHLLPEIDRGWLDAVANAFLVRDPAAMLPSLARNVPRPSLADTGLPQQVEIFESVRARTGVTPPVIDARDVLEDPRGMLGRLCAALGVEFLDAMLNWPPGRRPTDGVWAPYWYENVEKTTTFQPYAPRAEPVPSNLRPLLDECLPYYETLHAHRLRP